MATLQLPRAVQDAIAARLEGVPMREIARAAEELSAAYRRDGEAPAPRLDAMARLAYLATRLPATFGAVAAALQAAVDTVPDLEPATLLDLGAGPGAATMAALEVFPTIKRATMLERDGELQALAAELVPLISEHVALDARTGELPALGGAPRADLVVASYVLNELPRKLLGPAVFAAWGATAGTLVLVEPGTTSGFATILEARQILLAAGGRIAAPCPGGMTCPMAGTTSWCHFPTNIERSRVHRLAKGGSLGWELEKFSYLVVTRAAATPRIRIVVPSHRGKGASQFGLCTPQGLVEHDVPTRDKERHRAVRKLDWGDAWPEGV